MKLEECIKRIDKYMHSDDTHPRIVNIQNCIDMEAFCSHFNVGSSIFKDVKDYAKSDENPSEAALFNDFRSKSGCIFITGFATYYKLLGERKLNELLKKIVSFTCINNHIIFVCFQCEKYLKFSDVRYNNWVYLVDGELQPKTDVVFTSPDMPIVENAMYTNEIQTIPSAIEHNSITTLFVKTSKSKSQYDFSLISISEQTSAYSMLCSIDSLTEQLDEEYGNSEQWIFALNTIKSNSSWSKYAITFFGSIYTLDLSISKWSTFDSNRKWMYFILLKLFNAPNNWCLNYAVTLSKTQDDLIKNIYQGLLQIPFTSDKYWEYYNERKYLIKSIGISDVQIADFCDWVLSKGKDAIYYLSNLTSQEIKLIFRILNEHHSEFSKEEISDILQHIYPDLYEYLSPYNYKNDLLNNYFNEYKYQKVFNHISPEFKSIVEEQALKRDYNYILPSRSEKTESIDVKDTLVYFVDAMGVEYLSYIMSLCRKFNLIAYTTLCHCEIPSITSKNKDFIEVFEKNGAKFANGKNGIKSLDNLKHHGEEDFDYTNNTLPNYISEELRIINEIMNNIHLKIQQESYKKIVIISDHGASRLSVISNQENKHQMNTKGIHSGRCCPKNENDIQPECVIDGDDFWVIANYDRFKGGRPANIEVHGGATLEEVVIPIIEITKAESDFEFSVLTPNISFSKRKKNACIKVFSKTKLNEITAHISRINTSIKVNSSDGRNFIIDLPELKSSGDYVVDIYINDNLIKSGLKFHADNSDFKEKSLL